MRHAEGYLEDIPIADIYYQYWLPEDEPKAILLIVHGLAEHCGRYMNVVNHLVPSGYAVYGLDHIGHGKSKGERVHVDRFDDYTKILRKYFDMIKDSHANTPIFLIGHSMGGLISAAYLLDHQDELSGAVLSAPLIKLADNASPAMIFVGNLLSAIIPKANLVQVEAVGVSRDPKVVDAYINDPLVYSGKFTARLASEMLKTMKYVKEHAAEIKLPIMILQGSDDKLVDPSGAELIYDLVGSADKTIKIYPGLHHEVFNEPEHEQVLDDVKSWLEGHLVTA